MKSMNELATVNNIIPNVATFNILIVDNKINYKLNHEINVGLKNLIAKSISIIKNQLSIFFDGIHKH